MNESTLPITVIVPALNRADLLPRALASVSSQRPRRAAQVIVIDDGSDDDTAAVARDLGATVIVHERNLGLPSARNSGVKAAEHPWVALLDSDDEWLPNHLDTLWRLRDDNVFVATAAAVRTAGADPDSYYGPVRGSEERLSSPRDFVLTDNFVPPSASLISTEAARRAGLFRVGLPAAEDLDLWIRLLELGTATVTSEVTIVYHHHAGQMSADLTRLMSAHREVLASFSDRPWWDRAVLERYDGRIAIFEARRALAASDWPAAWRAVRQVLARPQRMVGAYDRLRRQVHVRRSNARQSASVAPVPGRG